MPALCYLLIMRFKISGFFCFPVSKANQKNQMKRIVFTFRISVPYGDGGFDAPTLCRIGTKLT